MTRGSLTVPVGTLASEAWGLLAEQDVAQAPVLDSLRRVVGLLLRDDMVPLELIPQSAGASGDCPGAAAGEGGDGVSRTDSKRKHGVASSSDRPAGHWPARSAGHQ